MRDSWVETKGKTLEEIDMLFDGEKHSDVPDVETVMKGKGNFEVLHGQVVGLDEAETTVVEMGTKK